MNKSLDQINKEAIDDKLQYVTKGKNFDNEQLTQIRYGLEHGVDVTKYADPKYSWRDMRNIRLSL